METFEEFYSLVKEINEDGWLFKNAYQMEIGENKWVVYISKVGYIFKIGDGSTLIEAFVDAINKPAYTHKEFGEIRLKKMHASKQERIKKAEAALDLFRN